MNWAYSLLLAAFTLVDDKIYDVNGNPFTPQGVNMFINTETSDTYSKITQDWQFNTIRLNTWVLPNRKNEDEPVSNYTNRCLHEPAEKPSGEVVYVDQARQAFCDYDAFRQVVESYTDLGLVVIIDIHDRIGHYFTSEELSEVKTFVKHVGTTFQDNPYVWIELRNEPGQEKICHQGDPTCVYQAETANVCPSEGFQVWKREVRQLLRALRRVNVNMIAVVTGASWGQDICHERNTNTIAEENSALLSHASWLSRQPRIILSFHVYDQWQNRDQTVMEDFFRRLIQNVRHPIMVSEFGGCNVCTPTFEVAEEMFDLFQLDTDLANIGRIVWHWYVNDENGLSEVMDNGQGGGLSSGAYIDINDLNASLSALGCLVWKDNQPFYDACSITNAKRDVMLQSCLMRPGCQ